ncbi:MAG: ATP-binding protein, partial [Acidimicrobiales bacterium]
MGDAIIALFGAPVAHEDDAERAVRAGLQMQQTIRSMSDGAAQRLELRVGINTGEVLVGAIRAGGDYTAMGDVVNVASRLQTMARPGSVVVGETTYAGTAAVVRYNDLGPQLARGREEPVPVWEAVESLTPPGQRPRRANAPLIGRDEEVGLFRSTLATAFGRRRPSLGVILGEAGVGKTRLVEELSDWARAEHGALVIEGRCVPYGEANPWWPVAEAVRQACGVDIGDPSSTAEDKTLSVVTDLLGADRDEEAAQIASGLLHLLGDEDALPDVDPQRARQEAQRALHSLMAGLARRQPLVVVLSEVHWADQLVLDLIGGQLDRLNGLPVVLLLTARPELALQWSPPSGRHNLVTLRLDPLDRAAARRLAQLLIEDALPEGSDDGRSAALIENLTDRSGGNPFFLEELVALIEDEATGTERPGVGGELPVTLRGIVAARLDSLPVGERSVLEDASVVGRSGTIRSLAAMARSRGIETIDAALGEVVARDLLKVEATRWEFRSDVVREVLYEILTKSERSRRHWNLASWVSEVSSKAKREDEFLEQVAHHFAAAAALTNEIGPVTGVPADAVTVAVGALRRAAGWALGRELLLSAVRMLDRAVELIPPDATGLLHPVLMDRAQARIQMRELAGARRDLEVLMEADAEASRATVMTLLGYLEQAEGDLDKSAASLALALELWRERQDVEGEGYALRGAGMTSFLSGDVVRAEGQLMKALSIARQLGRRRDEAWALWTLSWVSFAAGRLDEAEDRLGESSTAFRAAGDAGGDGWVKGLLGYIRLTQGRREEAEALALGLVDDAGDRGDRWAHAMVVVLLGLLRLWQGRVQSAVEYGRDAHATFTAIGDNAGLLRALGVLSRALAAFGQVGEARRYAEDALLLSRESPKLGMEPYIGQVLVTLVALHAGDWETAAAALDEIGTIAVANEVELRVARGLTLLQAGRPEDALTHLEVDAGPEARSGAEGPSLKGPTLGGAAPNLYATRAMTLAALGRAEPALEAAARAVNWEPAGTYRDRVLAGLGRAVARAQHGQLDAAE